MRCSIEIERLRLYAHHGVADQERVVGNLFEVSIEIFYSFQQAIETDNLSGTINYAAVVDIIKDQMAIPSLTLEHVAGRIMNTLVSHFPLVEGGTVKVTKITPPIAAELGGVAVKISW